MEQMKNILLYKVGRVQCEYDVFNVNMTRRIIITHQISTYLIINLDYNTCQYNNIIFFLLII